MLAEASLGDDRIYANATYWKEVVAKKSAMPTTEAASAIESIFTLYIP